MNYCFLLCFSFINELKCLKTKIITMENNCQTFCNLLTVLMMYILIHIFKDLN